MALLVELIDRGRTQGRDGEKNENSVAALREEAEEQAADDGRARARCAGNQREGLGDAELEGVGEGQVVDRFGANPVFAALGPQNDEGAQDEKSWRRRSG